MVAEYTGKRPSGGIAQFIEQYLVDFNAAAAAVRAGKTKQWSESHGIKALKNYAGYVAWLQKIRAVENSAKIAMTQEDIFSRMEVFADANIQDYFDFRTIEFKEKGKETVRKRIRIWKDPGDLTRKQAAAVKRVVLGDDGQVRDYILYDADSTLVSLGRHLGMFSEKVILEHRHKHLHMKADFSKMPIEKLLEMEKEFLQYLPEHQREAR